MREQIAEILKNRKVDTLFNEHVMGVYGKEDAPNCENYINTTTDQILSYQSEEIEKVENPIALHHKNAVFETDYHRGKYLGFEDFRQKILALLK